jgi:predicted aconitase with swiveling domain
MTVFNASAAMGTLVRGRAVVAKDGFSARYDLDRAKGVFSRPEHKLAGRSYVDVVLVLDAAKGGVATAWMLHEMKARGVVPVALVLNSVNPIMVQGAALADFTMISGFATDITQAVPDGALVEVDPTSDPPCLRILSVAAAEPDAVSGASMPGDNAAESTAESGPVATSTMSASTSPATVLGYGCALGIASGSVQGDTA